MFKILKRQNKTIRPLIFSFSFLNFICFTNWFLCLHNRTEQKKKREKW